MRKVAQIFDEWVAAGSAFDEPVAIFQIPAERSEGGSGTDFGGLESTDRRIVGGPLYHPDFEASVFVAFRKDGFGEASVACASVSYLDEPGDATAVSEHEVAGPRALRERPGVFAGESGDSIGIFAALFAYGEERHAAFQRPDRSTGSGLAGDGLVATTGEVFWEQGCVGNAGTYEPQSRILSASLDGAKKSPSGAGTTRDQEVEPCDAFVVPCVNGSDWRALPFRDEEDVAGL